MTDAEVQYDRICKTEFGQINTKLDRIDTSLRGNGKIGLMTRIDRLERMAKIQSRLIWVVLLSLISAAGTWIFS